MMTRGNKKPLTGKLKKKYIRMKREKKMNKKVLGESSDDNNSNSSNKKINPLIVNSDEYFRDNEESSATEKTLVKKVEEEKNLEFNSEFIYKINAQPKGSDKNINKYALQFYKESNEKLIKMKNEANKEYKQLAEEDIEIDDKTYDEFIKNSIPLPKRPKWYPELTKEQLLNNEYNYFRNYLKSLEEQYGNLSNLSFFELNLETWKQLWRTLEMSDIVLVITDIRYSIYHFPFTLYEYIVKDLKKKIILILNKCDLVEPELVIAWREFWSRKLPDIHIVPFSSYAGMRVKDTGKNKKKRFGKFQMASESVRHLYNACEKILDGRLNIKNWYKKIEYDLNEDVEYKYFQNKTFQEKPKKNNYEKSNKKLNHKTKLRLKNLKKLKSKSNKSESETENESETEYESEPEKSVKLEIQPQNYEYHEFKSLDGGILTIGCIGHPNVGKSSVLNAIIGKVVLSVSRTPGHTKHFQTIFLTENVKLCDCPGLVFPSKIPKQLQILMGCFPIAQLREPYSTITYIAQRINLIKILKIKKSEDYSYQGWSAMEICEQWAIKRGYFAAKSARPDVYRAANQILRMALDGRTICVKFYPPNYIKEVDTIWRKRNDLMPIRFLQCQTLRIQNEREREFKTTRKLKLANLKLTEKNSSDENKGKYDSSDEITDDQYNEDSKGTDTEDELSSS